MTVEDDRDNSPLEEQVFWCNSSSTTLYRLFLKVFLQYFADPLACVVDDG
jgi:hypothetical protein